MGRTPELANHAVDEGRQSCGQPVEFLCAGLGQRGSSRPPGDRRGATRLWTVGGQSVDNPGPQVDRMWAE